MESEFFNLGGQKYSVVDLDKSTRSICDLLIFAQKRLREKENQKAVLTKARNAYIIDIKNNALREKTGVDLKELFVDD